MASERELGDLALRSPPLCGKAFAIPMLVLGVILVLKRWHHCGTFAIVFLSKAYNGIRTKVRESKPVSLRSPLLYGKAFAIPMPVFGIILVLKRWRHCGTCKVALVLCGPLGLTTNRVRVKLLRHINSAY